MQLVKKTPAKVVEETNQRSKRERLKQEALLASSVAARELRAVVGLARRRGLNAEEVFQHFVVDDGEGTDAGGKETGRRGVAGQKEIIKGMEGLGISLSEEAATLLIETIVHSCVEPPPRLPTRPAADDGVKSSSSPPRQHINAQDLWKFAQAQRSEVVTSLNRREERGSAIGSDDSLPSESQEKLAMKGSKQSIHGESGPLCKRRRTKDTGDSRARGSTKRNTGKDAMKESPHGMGRTNRLSPLETHLIPGGASGSREPMSGQPPSWGNTQHAFGNYHASVSTMSSMFTGNDVRAGAGAGAASVRCIGHEEAAKKDAPRSHSMPNHANSVESRGKRNLQESGDRSLCPPRRKIFPVRAGSAVPRQDRPRVPAAQRCTPFKKAEVISFPCDNPSAEAMDSKDRVFHVDRCGKMHGEGCVCCEGNTYRP